MKKYLFSAPYPQDLALSITPLQNILFLPPSLLTPHYFIMFRTEITPKKSVYSINHQHKILTLGSCFAENIAKYIQENKFQVNVNPFGVLYNPVSINFALNMLLNNREFFETDLIYHNEQWHSFYHHSSFSSADKEECLNKINRSFRSGHEFLKKTDFLTITFGSAYVYKYKKSRNVVSNCHKLPDKEFIQYMLNLDIISYWSGLIKQLKQFNPGLKIIFTVSPIRYLKYGAEKNSLSKSILILTIQQLREQFDFIDYFPAYEIMLDDLRDYRFYEKDMIHPNSTAIDYIWNKFRDSYMNPETIKIMEKLEKINQAKNHRTRNYESEAHQKFLINQLKVINDLNEKFPLLDFSEEINYFNSQLIK